MARLPQPGGDDGSWGGILNDFLSVEHNADGTLKQAGSLATKANDNAVVHNSGTEAIAGTKSFQDSPNVPAPTQSSHAATKAYVDSTVSAGAPDASASTKGIVQLAGDLGGTASSPTVPGLTSKQPLNADLTAIAALTPADNDLLQRKGGTWTNRTPVQVKSDLALAESDIANLTIDLAATEKTVNKGQANGYTPLDSGSKVPTTNLGSGTADSSHYLRGDQTWASLPVAPVVSVFGRTGVVTAQSGDYTAAQVGAAQGLTPTSVKTTAYTANPGDFIPVDASGGSVTITLPTVPADKTRIAVKVINISGSNTVSIAAGGSDVFNKTGGSASLTLSLLNQASTVQYNAGTAIWYVQSDDIPLSQIDARYLAANGVTVSGSPTAGQVLTATSGVAAHWSTPSSAVTVMAPAPSGDTSGATDTPALNTALSGMSTGTFQLQAGTYYLNAPLAITTSGITVQGEGENTTLKLANNSNCNVITVGISGTNINNVLLRDFSIDGNNSHNRAGNGLALFGSRYSKYERLYFTSVADWDILAFGTNSTGFGYDNIYESLVFDLSGGCFYDQYSEAETIYNCKFKYAIGVSRSDASGVSFSSSSSTISDTNITLTDAYKWVSGTNLPGSAGNPTIQCVNVVAGVSFQIATLTNGTASGTATLTVGGRSDPNCTTDTSGPFVLDAAIQAADQGQSVSGTGIPANATVCNVVPGVGFWIGVLATPTGSGTSVTLAWPTQEQGHLTLKNGGHRIHHNIFGSGGTYPGNAITLENSLPSTIDHNRFDQVRQTAIRAQASGCAIIIGNDFGSCAGYKSGTVNQYNVIDLAADRCVVIGNKTFNTSGSSPDSTHTVWKYSVQEVGSHDYNVITGNNWMLANGMAATMSFNGAHTIALSNPGSSDYGIAGDVTGNLSATVVSAIQGVTISGTPSAGNVLTATASNAAHWAVPASSTFPLGVHATQTGEYTVPTGIAGLGTSNTQSLVNLGQMDLIAIDVLSQQTFSAIGMNVNVVGAGTGLAVRLGIYNDDGTYSRPSGTPLLDAGTFDPTSGTGDRTITISQALSPGRYWLAAVLQGSAVTTVPTITCITSNVEAYPLTSLGSNAQTKKWFMTGVSGALPAISSLGRSSAQPPLIGLKI